MLKFLIILVLIIYLLYRVGGFLFRLFFLNASEYQQQQQQQRRTGSYDHHSDKRKAPDSNLNIDYVPRDSKGKKIDGYKGGEYVDYEEVD